MIENETQQDLKWFKSTRSNASRECVEVAFTERGTAVRDTKEQGRGPVLKFTADEWSDFVGKYGS